MAIDIFEVILFGDQIKYKIVRINVENFGNR